MSLCRIICVCDYYVRAYVCTCVHRCNVPCHACTYVCHVSLCVQEACWPLCCSSLQSLSGRLSLGSPSRCSLRSGDTNTSAHQLTFNDVWNTILSFVSQLLFFPYSSILSGVFTSLCILFFQLLSSCTPVVLSPPSSLSLNCPPHFHLHPSIMAQLLTGCIYHPKEAPQPQSQGTAGAGLVVHKQAFHTTAKCVGVVSLAEPSQTHRVVEMFISDVQSESTTTSVKLLALVSIGEIGRRR